MNPKIAFATVAHFAVAAVEHDHSSLLTVYTALTSVASGLGLSNERKTAEKAVAALRNADQAQMTFDALIRESLGKGAA